LETYTPPLLKLQMRGASVRGNQLSKLWVLMGALQIVVHKAFRIFIAAIDGFAKILKDSASVLMKGNCLFTTALPDYRVGNAERASVDL
jgi:hypothetical protein